MKRTISFIVILAILSGILSLCACEYSKYKEIERGVRLEINSEDITHIVYSSSMLQSSVTDMNKNDIPSFIDVIDVSYIEVEKFETDESFKDIYHISLNSENIVTGIIVISDAKQRLYVEYIYENGNTRYFISEKAVKIPGKYLDI